MILVGERAATTPGTLSAAAALAADTGARLAWVPRRAGEVGAVDAGALPTLLPGGRTVDNDTDRAAVAAQWDAELPAAAGRDADAILDALAHGTLGAVITGGIDPDDFADPALATQAFDNAGFIVSLEVRRSAVTERADVVLPVAPAAEKAGRYVTWEGRRRPFDLTITNHGALSDARVLDSLADELDVFLGLASLEAVRDELIRLAPSGAPRPAFTPVEPAQAEAADRAGYTLATWPELLDAGRLQDGDDHLAGTAKPARVVLSRTTASELGIAGGDAVTVRNEIGALTLPAAIDATIPDDVVWVPTNARGAAVRRAFGTVRTVEIEKVEGVFE